MIELNQILHADCMDVMRDIPDNYFELAIVDPPYGIGEDGSKGVRTSPSRPNSYLREPKYKNGGWDKESPSPKYFAELMRISQNQIIWGANHFISKIPYDSSCWIVWDKDNEGTDFADCELAWTSFKTTVRKFHGHKFIGTKGGQLCIHPTQKPVKLYKWLLDKYATCKYCNNEGFLMECIGEKWMGSVQVDCEACDVATEGKPKILDTHAGSCSSVIACIDYGFEYLAIEKDEDYFNQAVKRVENHKAQTNLFN